MSDSLRPHGLQNEKPGFSVLHRLLEFPQTHVHWGFPGDSAGKESTCNAEDLSSIPGLGRSPEEGKGYPCQYSGLENSMDCIFHGATELEQLSLSFTFMSTELVVPSSHLILCCSFLLLPLIYPSIRL